MERFTIKKSERKPNNWVCADTINGIVCVFENGRFNETQEFTILEDIAMPDANKLARAANDMAAWLRANHYAKIMISHRERIGKRIAGLRKKQGISQIKLAELTGIAASNIARIELGKYSTGIDLLSKIAHALGCQLDVVEY
ncbi:MAG: helix-turn-helix domain-containing protein [Dysgonamonadaceae bacterium]|jgi:DNA-binding XRE family transcriptional regulator|nr:helix-turn-helix domain-containing protein [Dysgonamonadaceae bacterium]